MPTKEIAAGSADAFTIPESLLVTEDVETPFYANAHIHKSYVLEPPAAKTAEAAKPAADDDADLAALFASVDVDGDGQITKEEAMDYIRSKSLALRRRSRRLAAGHGQRRGYSASRRPRLRQGLRHDGQPCQRDRRGRCPRSRRELRRHTVCRYGMPAPLGRRGAPVRPRRTTARTGSNLDHLYSCK